MNRYPLTSTNPSLVYQRPKRRDKATSKTRCGQKVDPFGQRYQIDIRLLNANLLCKSSPMSEPRLAMGVADVSVAKRTLITCATATTEWNCNAIPHLEPLN